MKLSAILMVFLHCCGLLFLSVPAMAIEESKPAEEILDFQAASDASPAPAEDSTNDIKKILTDYYKRTSNYLKNVEAYRKAADSYESSLEEAPLETRKIRKKLARPVKLPTADSMQIADDVPLPEIGQRLYKERDVLDAEIQKLTELSAKIKETENRLLEARARIDVAKSRISEISEELDARTEENELGAVTEARSWALEAESLALEAEIQMLEKEISSQPVRLALLKAKRDELKRNVARIQQRVTILAERMNQQIESEVALEAGAIPEGKQTASSKEQSSLRKELEKQRIRLEKKIDFTGNISLAVKNQQGNTEKSEAELDGEIDLRRKKDRFNVIGHMENDRAQTVQTAYNWFLISKYDYFVSKKLFYGAGLGFEQDEFADLNLRVKLGPHVGYQFYESRAMNLQLQGGISLVSEDYINNQDYEFAGGTWVLNFDKYYFDELFQFYAYHSGLNQFGKGDKLVTKTWAGLRFPLIYKLFLAVEVKHEYDSQPAAGKLKVDTTQSLKIGYKW